MASFKKFVKGTLTLAVIAALLGGAALAARHFLRSGVDESSAVYKTAKIQRGDLSLTINATGTVEPEELINVGAQVAGRILSFGKDGKDRPIDYGSEVEEGTVLANIDDSTYVAAEQQAEAQVLQSKGALQKAEADLEQAKAKLELAQQDWARAQKLHPADVMAKSSFDSYKSAYNTAKASISVAEAAIVQAKGSLAFAEAALQQAKWNLGYCTIKSPVRGIVIDRRVNIGQTVVASLSAPSLFLIAKDLKRMQVWVPVNEADIGKIYVGQPAHFTADAFPGETFRGEVGKIRLNASMTNNVVSYTVEVRTDNSSGKLLPYLTANVSFELASKKNVLLAPSAALRWSPANGAGRTGESGKAAPAAGKKHKDTEKQSSGSLWVLDGEKPRAVAVTTGLSDGVTTEVSGDISEGMEVVTGQSADASGSSSGGTRTPFLPRMR